MVRSLSCSVFRPNRRATRSTRRWRWRRRWRGDEVGATPSTLTSFEVAVAGAGATLTRLELVGIHGEAHRAPRLPPVKAGFAEDLRQALGFGLLLDQAGARHDKGAHAVGDLAALGDGGRRSQILDRLFVQLPMKTVSTLMSLIGVPASKSMYSRARAAVLARFGSSKSSGPGISHRSA